MQYPLTSSSPSFELLLQASSLDSSTKDTQTSRPQTTESPSPLTSSSSSTSLQNPFQLQNVRLKEKVQYLYHRRINYKNELYESPFPIFKSQNHCLFRGSLVAQFDRRPKVADVEEAIKQALKVYKRVPGQPLKEKPSKIEKVFHHTEKEALMVTVQRLQSNQNNYHCTFTLKVVFGSNTASKISKVFWTVKLKDQVIAEDILIEQDTAKRDLKIDRKLKKGGTPFFEEWEQNVCWYKEYAATLKSQKFKEKKDIEEELEEGEINELEDEDSSDDWSPTPSQNIENPIDEDDDDEEFHLAIAESLAYNPPETRRKRRLSVGHDESSAVVSAHEANKRPARESSVTSSTEHPLATAQSCAEQIQTLMPSIMRSLQLQSEAATQKETRIAELEQEVKNKQTLLDQQTQEIETAKAQLTESQTEKQRLETEIAALKAQPNLQDLQTQLREATNARVGLDICYKNAQSQLKKRDGELESAKKANASYKTQLDQALKSQEETRVLLQQAQQTIKDLKASQEEELARLQIENLTLMSQNATLLPVQAELEQLKALYQRVFKHNQQLETELQQARANATEARKLSEERMSHLTKQSQELRRTKAHSDDLEGQLQREKSSHQQTRDTLRDKERSLLRAQEEVNRWEQWQRQGPPSIRSPSTSRQNYRH